uniref:Uncharacterized protein n=1 Tax=Falco tinnunculus TaxID=100819 RepID=A0A8C4U224_FALTI
MSSSSLQTAPAQVPHEAASPASKPAPASALLSPQVLPAACSSIGFLWEKELVAKNNYFSKTVEEKLTAYIEANEEKQKADTAAKLKDLPVRHQIVQNLSVNLFHLIN